MITIVVTGLLCMTCVVITALVCFVGVTINHTRKELTEQPKVIYKTKDTELPQQTDTQETPPSMDDIIAAVNEVIGGIDYD